MMVDGRKFRILTHFRKEILKFFTAFKSHFFVFVNQKACTGLLLFKVLLHSINFASHSFHSKSN